MEPESLTVTVHTNGKTGDRVLTVDHWPRYTRIDYVFLKNADPKYCAQDGNIVTLTVANGQAVYELGEFEIYSMTRKAWLVSSRLSEWSQD